MQRTLAVTLVCLAFVVACAFIGGSSAVKRDSSPFARRIAFDAVAVAVEQAVATVQPLVSVIIPTHDRAEFLGQAIRQIQRQDYPNLEIIIVDDSEIAQPELQDLDKRVTYIHLAKRLSIGEKRNIAVQNAKGAVIVHWDDDDYFRSHRISAQVAPIVSGEASMTVLEHHFYYVLASDQFYTVKRPSSWGPHFGTFAYAREVFSGESQIRYPDTSLAEDYSFAELALNAGYTIKVLNNEDGKHVYVRHENTWQFNFEEYGAQVKEVAVPEFMSQEDHSFLRSVKIVAPHAQAPNHFVSAATKWDRKELHPANDEEDVEFDEMGFAKAKPKYPHYGPHYKKKDNGLSTGAKIGIGVGVAGGVVAIVVVGIAAYFFFQWQKRRYPGYTRINTDV